MALTMLLRAISSAAAHVASTQGAWPKARLTALLTYVFVKEVVGFAVVLPSLSRSFFIYTSLPAHRNHVLQPITITSKRKRLRTHLPWLGAFNVSVARNIPYGKARRNLLDVYVPNAAASSGLQRKWPAVMFVHGGAWATGSKEFFSHLGACLAHSGVLTVLVQYTLFPEVLAWEQVREVSRALTWFLDNVEHYGGDPQRVTLMGHSAGAHLCALVMWERFKAAQQLQQRRAAATCSLASEPQLEIDEEDLDEQDIRQPGNFIGLAGVYDIVEHLKYERKRGVDVMSPMTPAMGGRHLLEAMSPVHLFHGVGASTRTSMVNADTNIHMMGENIYDTAMDKMNKLGAVDAGLCAARVTHCNGEVHHGSSNNYVDVGSCTVSVDDGTRHRSHLPSCTLLCSQGDIVVRPDTSISFHTVLQEQLGHPSQLFVFDNLAHSDFVILDGRSPELVSLRQHVLHILQP